MIFKSSKLNPRHTITVFLILAASFTGPVQKLYAQEGWSGIVTFRRVISGTDVQSEWVMEAVLNNNKGTATHRSKFSRASGYYHGECAGEDIVEGEVDIYPVKGTYDIVVPIPQCDGSQMNGSEKSDYGEEETVFEVHGQKLGSNPNIVTGSIVEKDPDPDGNHVTITTWTWSLYRGDINEELIVTPANYDNWLPVPGKDETTPGSVMMLNFKLQRKNGKPLTFKAKNFICHLLNTSAEPGITLNMPSQNAATSPDMQFISKDDNDQLADSNQSITVPSIDGITGGAFVAAFDGGGWTTLTVEAVLENGIRIKGELLLSGGTKEITIPKRNPGSKIATVWLNANGNPSEMDDRDNSKDNSNKGDGFTAYEEYRGIISEGKFNRLNPNKKEVGILATQTDFSLFKEGLSWFKNASDLEIVRFDFDKDEVAPDGKINMNAKSAHNYDQYAIYIADGGLGGTRTLGVCYGRRIPLIPANIDGVIIDWTYIQKAYQKRINEAKPDIPKFSLSEYLAQTVAHELGHAVNISHHGVDNVQGPFEYNIPDTSGKVRIFDRTGKLMPNGHYTLKMVGFSNATVESGDMLCMLNYYPYYHWGFAAGNNGAQIFNEVPLLPLGRIFCKNKNGTGINSTQLYFGVASEGDCLGQIELRN